MPPELSDAAAHYPTLLSQLRHDLDDVEAALARLEDGSYGRCEACGAVLGPEVLAAAPAQRRCPGCSEEPSGEPSS